VAGCCECDDEPSGSCATELVSYVVFFQNVNTCPVDRQVFTEIHVQRSLDGEVRTTISLDSLKPLSEEESQLGVMSCKVSI
jgi:hypothetical protein